MAHKSRSSDHARVLAFLALLGVGQTASAQDLAVAEGEKVAISCDRQIAVPGFANIANFSGRFETVDGYIYAEQDGSQSLDLTIPASDVQLAEGVTFSIQDSYDDNGNYLGSVDQYPGLEFLGQTSSGTFEETLSFNIALASGIAMKPVDLRLLRGNTVLATLQDASLSGNVQGQNPANYNVSYQFAGPDLQRWFAAPIAIEVVQDGRILSRTFFDSAAVPAYSIIAQQVASIEGPANAEAPPEGCSVSQGCFLTTAAVEVVGLDDNCWELRCLRRFRDALVASDAGGHGDLVQQYYRDAPQIVSAISARPDATRIWLKTYWLGIVPAATATTLGQKALALHIYGFWTRRLARIAAANRANAALA